MGIPANRLSDSRGVIHRVSDLSLVGECWVGLPGLPGSVALQIDLQVVSTIYFGNFQLWRVEMPRYGWPMSRTILGRITVLLLTVAVTRSFYP